MEPRIQYAQTADGVSIAFWTLGEGMPLVYMSGVPFAHAQLVWQMPEYRSWFERLAQKRKVVRYDCRGTGLSDRDTVFSLDALVLDVEAMVHHLGLERFALFGQGNVGPVAIAYTARHPERVSHLILWCSWARTSDATSPQLRGLRRLMNTNWELYTETLAHALWGWAEGEPAHRWAEIMRQSVTPEAGKEALEAFRDVDVTGLLPQVRSPTLVLHRREAPMPDMNVARGLASRIPDARLALLEGTSVAPSLGDMEAVLSAIDEFLGEGEETAAGATPPPAGGVHTILFTDVEGSTELTQRLGDAKAQELLRTHNSIVRDALKAHGGSEVKTMGDGFMASFSSATRALECAIAMQRAFAEWNEAAAARPSTGSGRAEVIRVRIGLNAGEPVAEEHDLFGTAVQLAARICSHAEPGQILVSDVVRQLVAGKGLLFSDRGETVLRGFEDPVRLYEVRWAA